MSGKIRKEELEQSQTYPTLLTLISPSVHILCIEYVTAKKRRLTQRPFTNLRAPGYVAFPDRCHRRCFREMRRMVALGTEEDSSLSSPPGRVEFDECFNRALLWVKRCGCVWWSGVDFFLYKEKIGRIFMHQKQQWYYHWHRRRRGVGRGKRFLNLIG